MFRNSAGKVRILLALGGIALIVVLIARVGPGAIAERFSGVGFEIVWVVVPYAIGTAIGAFPWVWLLPVAGRPGLGAAIKSRLAASGANALLPFFALAGEPARLLWLKTNLRAAGTAALVVDRIVYNCASAVFLLTGVGLALTATALPRSIAFVAALIGVSVLGVTIGLGFATSRYGLGARLEKFARQKLPLGKSPAAFGAEVDRTVRALFHGPRRPLLLGFLTHFVSRVVLGAEVFVALWVLDVPVTPEVAYVLATVHVATAAVGSAIPGQLGVLEGGQALVTAALGMDASVGISLVLVGRLRQLVFAPLTVLLISTARADDHAARRAPLTTENAQ